MAAKKQKPILMVSSAVYGFEELRILDMYDLATRQDVEVYRDRDGNWVQKFGSTEEASLYAVSQFRRYQEAEAFVSDKFGDIKAVKNATNQRRGAPTLTLGDLHHEQIETMVQKAIGDGRFPFSDPQSIETVLGELGMFSGGVLTNAADVCFGIKPAIRNPQVRMRAYAFQSDKRGDEYLDQDDFNGPLANVLASAVAFIQRNSSRAAMFLPESVERQNLAAYPATAVREGLVNALAHRDYSRFSSGASILVYPDRLEIWNSGKLPDGWTASKLRQNHPSIPTNPDIANFLFIRSLMERIGRGTQRMIEDCREAGLPAPIWRVDEDGITLTLYSQGSPEAPASRLNERQLGLLNALSDGDTIRLRDYLERFAEGVTERQAQRDLSELRDADLLRFEGRGRATHYVRTKRKTPE